MTMPIDVRQVDWLYVVILALFALVANLIANLLSFRRRGLAAVLAAVLFAAAFVFWTYYPHATELASLTKDNRAVLLEMLIQHDAQMQAMQKLCE
jgi:hypothetical protein